ncbi:MAG TPA: prepilin-type N-terminal cleavage/methylation domain-containing protein [Anaeromyxobacteraceae bacterium]|nr:prepilin-type N-terminal cleavage/methylation domain-containing protein [Anaeromyxobacteraceae bacterium]
MRTRTQRGFTLMEVVTALAISMLLTVLVIQALVGLAKDRTGREYVIEAQGSARLGLAALEQDVRTASLGSGSGTIWINASGTRTAVPAIQIYDDVPGATLVTDPARNGLAFGPKPGTDVLLVVQAARLRPNEPRVGARGDQFNSTNGIVVGDPTPALLSEVFSSGDAILFGDYGDAAWDRVTNVNDSAKTLSLASAVDLFPRKGVQLPTGPVQPGKLASGSMVRRAQARLYYVNVNDELVRLTLASPVAPANNGAAILGREVLGTGFENMQIDCQMETGTGLGPCAAPAADPSATVAFGASASRITAGNAATLRTVSIGVVVRSSKPLREQQGDPAIPDPVATRTLQAAGPGVDAAAAYARRAYQVQIGVRNTSLGVL